MCIRDRCPAEFQAGLASNIVLSGGNVIFTGLDERLQLELDQQVGQLQPVVVPEDKGERKYHCFVGASIISQLDGINWVTRELYDEYGAAVVHEACPVGLDVFT
eukprot:TRINITY_DN50615_c0_g1_i2.p1 TRINITY_DN50615_c0_g1~~TRINITY_DN50615_c0_g1_i2.p1  ORF type:complete len:104 (-),score=23.96 TRINITY_DN50615_c0_g1_i2:157-468(-)